MFGAGAFWCGLTGITDFPRIPEEWAGLFVEGFLLEIIGYDDDGERGGCGVRNCALLFVVE